MLSEQESYERMVGSAIKKGREIEAKERRNRDKIEIKSRTKNYGTRKENQIGSAAGEVAKMATLPVSGFCDGGAALWVVQEKETQPELAQRRETERLVEFGVSTGFCGVLRVHDGVKHVRK